MASPAPHNCNTAALSPTGKLPESLSRLRALSELDLSHNLLKGSIPKCFSHLDGLEDLVLSYNALQGKTIQRY